MPERSPQQHVEQWYRRFAEGEARGQSDTYEAWALGVADDPGVIELIASLPPSKRQPNLIFAVSRLLGAPETGYPPWREWLLEHWTAVAAEAMQRSTQTNEPRRCAALLPVLSALPGPLALLEVGASAGLCLYPDRYSYHYDDAEVLGDGRLVLDVATNGAVPVPERLPDVVWRAGLDLAPLRLDDVDDMEWLETLIWPEQDERRRRIRTALEIAREEPPLIEAGDAVDDLAALAARAPANATLVVMTAGVLVYLSPADRQRFTDVVAGLDATWVSLESPAVLPDVQQRLAAHPPPEPGLFALAVDDHPVAYAGPHGQSLHWLRGLP